MNQKFGLHASIAGGLHNALLIAGRLGCDCLQIFVKNQRQWHAPPLAPDHLRRWRELRREIPCSPIFAHGTYLINLAADSDTIRRRSIDAFVDELGRCQTLDLDGLIIHPGAHTGQGPAKGIRRVIESITEIMERTGDCPIPILLETTAGQGTCLGHRFEHLAEIIAGIEANQQARLAVCLDTCHLHAAGYDLAREAGYDNMLADLLAHLGIDRVRCIHVNDSVKPAGSHVDRHAHIGQGTIGLPGFRRLLRDASLAHIPKILETPKELTPDGQDYDEVNLQQLRTLARQRQASARRHRT